MRCVRELAPLGLLVLLLPGLARAQAGQDYEKAIEAARKYQQQSGAAGAATPAPAAQQIVQFSEPEVAGYIETLKGLKALGLRLDQEASQEGSQSSTTTMQAIEASDEAVAIVRKNGFTLERLSRVAYSISMALASTDVKKEDLAKARAQSEQALEQMKGRLPEAQIALMKQQMQASMKMTDQLQDQPKQNLDLVAKYRKQLEAVHR